MRYGFLRIGAGLIAILFAAAPVLADQPATQPAPTTAPASAWPKLFSELASTDLDTRIAARRSLMQLQRSDLPALREIVAHSHPILPAQAAVLHDIVQEIYLAGDKYEVEPKKGFLGILMDEAQRADVGAENDGNYPIGIIVADRFPGFCASRSLVDGDIILGLATPFTPFRSRMDLTNAVGGSPPGTVVGLLVLRQGQIMSVTLTLDAHPAQQLVIDDNGAMFRADRQRKFEAYWHANFKSLLPQQLG